MVGRPERELQDDGTPLVRLASDLRELRRSAGSPSYRELAQRAHRSQTTLSEAAGGERLPTWDTVQSYVTACGGDADGWLPRWEAASGRAAGPGPATAGEPGAELSPEPADGAAVGTALGAADVVEGAAAAPQRREWAWPAAVVAGLLLGLLVGYALGSSGDGGGAATAVGRAATQTVTVSPSESPSLAVRDGSDPEDTGCARVPGVVTLDTTEVDLDGRPVGLAQLKYSPACGAAWPRFVPFTDDAVPAGVVVHTDVVRPAPDGGDPQEVFPFSAEHVVGQETFGNLAVSTSGCVYAAVRLGTDAGETVDSKTHCFRGATYVR